MNNSEIIKKLKELSKGEEKYKEFNTRIINDLGGVKFLGVRIPNLKKFSKEIAKGDYKKFIQNNDWSIYEMKQIAFMIPSFLINASDEEFFEVIELLIPHASSWANCDSLGLKLRYNKEKMWDKIKKYLDSNDVWTVRIGLNFVMANYLDDEYIDRVIKEIKLIDSRYQEKAKRGTLNYYAKMMMAWTLAEAAINYREKVEDILPKLDDETAKYTRQKMRDSYRIK